MGASVGEGTIVTTVKNGAQRLVPALESIKQGIMSSPVVHFDETGMRIAGSLHWLHTAGTKHLTFYMADPKRGRKAFNRMGILPEYGGTAVHDGLQSYRGYACNHALCNAHHLRELEGVHESTGQDWARQLADLLRQAHRWKRQDRLTPTRKRRIPQRYDTILERGRVANFYDLREAVAQMENGKLKRTTAQRLVARLIRDKDATLRFVTDPEVPFDNNLAERDLRMMKVKQKVSGCFRSMEGADHFVAMRSYISTMRKQGVNVLEALTSVYAGATILPAQG
jgi:transposase